MEEGKYSTWSSDREERIATRRARIAAERNRQLNAQGEDGARKAGESEESSKGTKQIAESRKRIDHSKQKGFDDLTAIRVAGDEREHSRRELEEAAHLKREKRRKDEEVTSQLHAAVDIKWDFLEEHTIPQELLKDIEEQKAKCDMIIAAKDKLIEEFQKDLRSKDEEYVRALKKNAEDIDVIIEKMGKQFGKLSGEYENELQDIETAFMQERAELLEANRSELESLFEKRRNAEQEYMEMRQKRIEQNQKELDAMRVEDAEKYNILKIKLETEIQNLEQQLEEMRATYQLNTEKLEYNFRVLTERDLENSHTISQQKRKLARLQDVLSGLMARYAKTDKEYRAANNEITDEYKRITEQFKDLQNKFLHFEQADAKKYREVWKMNEKQVIEYVKKVLQADKIIHEQQLGLQWIPPSDDLFNLTVEDRGKNTDTPEQEEEEEQALDAAELVSSDEFVRKMLAVLCDEAGFLVEGKIQQYLEPLAKDQQELLKIDSILKALEVESQDDVNMLLSYFVKEGRHDRELIHPNDAIKAIKEFVEDHQQQLLTSKKARKKTMARADKVQFRKEEKQFWERMSQVIDEKTYRVWQTLEKSLHEYNKTLSDRSNLIDETDSLRQQNAELKMLLNQYLTSRVNRELVIPPTQLLATT